jgi:hypothetical protein
MSAMSEEQPGPAPAADPQDPLAWAPRRPSERAEPRLASVNDTPRATRPEPASRPLPASAALSAKLESAVYESLRRPVEPQIVPDPNDFRRQDKRRTLIAIASGVGAALAVAAVAAVLFLTVYPRERDSGQPFAAPMQQAASHPADDPKPALSQFRALVAGNRDSQNFTHEQSERLLQQFVQWRQKAASPDKP